MRVLAVRSDSVGDVLLCGPALRAIAARASRVTMLCGPQGTAAGHLLPGVDEVLTWSAPWITDPAPDFTSVTAGDLIDMVAATRSDAAVIFTSFHQSPLPLAALLRLAGVGHITGASVDFAGSLLDVRLRPGEDFPEDQPEVLRALGIAEAAGFPRPEDTRLRVEMDPGSAAAAAALVPPGPYVVVHPGASVPARQWPAADHRDLVRELHRRGRAVVVTGTPAERRLTAYVAGDSGIDAGGRTNLAELAHVLAGAEVLIAGNTGPAHLATAVGTRVVSLFSPVVPAIRWAPWGVPTILLGDQGAPCRGTRARQCPVPGHPCLSDVRPETVADASEQLIAEMEGAGL